MKARYCVALMVATLVFFLPLSARAEIKAGSVELGLFGGYNFFENSQNLKDRSVIGGRLGYNFTPYLGMEGALEFISTRVDDDSIRGTEEGQYRDDMDRVRLNFYHVDAVVHFMPASDFNPFILAGFGGTHYYPEISDKDMSAFNVGVGAKYWLSDNFALRVDVRDYMVTEIFQETYHNVAATVGITIALGGREASAPPQAEKPKAQPAPQPAEVAKPAKPVPAPPVPAPKAQPAPQPAEVAKPAKPAPVPPVPAPKAQPAPQMAEVAKPAPKAQPAPKPAEVVVVLVAEPKVEEKVIVLVAEPKIEEKVIVLALEDIHFDYDKSTLNQSARAILKRNLQILNENPKAHFRIAGYTSAYGTEPYNQKLSERRAKAVMDYLISEGVVTPDRLTMIGFGETSPAVYEAAPKDLYSKAAKANMRVLFEIVVK